MVAGQRIKKGEEIFNDYGALPRSDLLRRYGYVTDRYSLWDVVELETQKILNIAAQDGGLTTTDMDKRVNTHLAMGDLVADDTNSGS